MVNALLRGPFIMNMQVLCNMQQQPQNKLLDYKMQGQALYNLTHRAVWQDDYSLPNGGITKTVGLTRIPVTIDKRFNLKLMNEAFDLAMIEANIKNGMIADVISSVVQKNC